MEDEIAKRYTYISGSGKGVYDVVKDDPVQEQQDEKDKIDSCLNGEKPERKIVLTKTWTFEQIGKLFRRIFGASALLLILALSVYGADCNYNGKLPDAKCTPGAINKAVTQANIQQTICNKAGYTKKIRPPVKVTDKIKVQVMQRYGAKGKPPEYELDHLISLELGGCPDCVTNLWPQPYLPKPGAREKDVVEDDLHKRVCRAEITLAEAQQIIATDWFSYYKSLRR